MTTTLSSRLRAAMVVCALLTVQALLAFDVKEIIPANRSEVKSLTTITLKLDAPLGEWQPAPYALPINNAPLTYQAIVHQEDFSDEVTITIEPALDLPGTYEIIIPKEYVWDRNFDYLPEIQLVYVVNSGVVPPEDLVKYDLEYASVTPEPGRVGTPLSKVSVQYGSEIFVTEETDERHVRGRLYNQYDLVVANGVVKKVADQTVEVVLSQTVKTKGNYTFVIEKGVIGDASWYQDNAKGHANDEIRVEYALDASTSVDEVRSGDVEVVAGANRIAVSGVADRLPVLLYSVSGKLLESRVTDASQVVFDGLVSGIYLLRMGDVVKKVYVDSCR